MITAKLGNIFEFIYLDGPFPTDAGPGILPWFEGMGPYFSWGSPSVGSSSSIPSSTAISPTPQSEIDEVEKREMAGVNRVLDMMMEGNQASRVVGVLGFSQGTRVVSGLLRRQEIMEKVAGMEVGVGGESDLMGEKKRAIIRFGVLVCGGGGLSFRPFDLIPPEYRTKITASLDSEEKICIPTVHVHGMQDQIAQKGAELVEAWFDEKNARVLSVQAGHHFPREKEDVDLVCRSILEVWEMSRASWELEVGR